MTYYIKFLITHSVHTESRFWWKNSQILGRISLPSSGDGNYWLLVSHSCHPLTKTERLNLPKIREFFHQNLDSESVMLCLCLIYFLMLMVKLFWLFLKLVAKLDCCDSFASLLGFILRSWYILGRSQWSSFTLMDLIDQICSFSSLVLAVNKTIVVCTALNTFLSLSLSLTLRLECVIWNYVSIVQKHSLPPYIQFVDMC